jgi:hypothetical protein
MWRILLAALPLALGIGGGMAAIRRKAYWRFGLVALIAIAGGLGPALYILFDYRLQLCGSSDCGITGGIFYVAGLASLLFAIGWLVGGVAGLTVNREQRVSE